MPTRSAWHVVAVGAAAAILFGGSCSSPATPPGKEPSSVPTVDAVFAPAPEGIDQAEPPSASGVSACGMIVAGANEPTDRLPLTSSIWSIDPDGGGRRKIFEGEMDQPPLPVVSPAGHFIAFGRAGYHRLPEDKYFYEIIAMTPDGSKTWRLTKPFLSNDPEPAWSPDERRLAFVVEDNGSNAVGLSTIYTVDLTGAVTKVAPGTDPSWSPDGSTIAFTGFDERASYAYTSIFTAGADGGGVARMTSPDDARDSKPEFSPDGTEIMFQRTPAHGAGFNGDYSDLWSVAFPAADERQITNVQSRVTGVELGTWAPSGDRIVFVQRSDMYTALGIQDLDEDEDEAIATSGFGWKDPDWSPDGERLVALRSNENLWTLTSSLQDPVVLTAGLGRIFATPDWAPC